MASPGESKVDENEVTSEPHHHHHRRREPTHGGDDRGQDLDLAFPLIRQSSIYSLTLDEIQNTVCEPGKSFGSMNMDEFLNNIWSVEEAGFGAAPDSTAPSTAQPNGTRASPPLQQQGSLTVPAPLCRKTVDEVWAEIHREREVLHSSGRARHGGGGNAAGNAHRQPTFGEMTLEDFLVKAGVVREGLGPASPHPPLSSTVPMQQSAFGVPTTNYPIVTGAEGAGFGHVVGYEYHTHHRPAASEGHAKRYGMQQVPVGSPVSPASSDGPGGGQADNSSG